MPAADDPGRVIGGECERRAVLGLTPLGLTPLGLTPRGCVLLRSRKQKKFPLYELELTLKWEGQLWGSDGETTAEASERAILFDHSLLLFVFSFILFFCVQSRKEWLGNAQRLGNAQTLGSAPQRSASYDGRVSFFSLCRRVER